MSEYDDIYRLWEPMNRKLARQYGRSTPEPKAIKERRKEYAKILAQIKKGKIPKTGG